MSSSDRPQHPQVRPAYPKQPEGTLDEQRALNLKELGLLPRKGSQKPPGNLLRSHSSQGLTHRPAATTALSHQSAARPTYNRQISNLSTHTPSGQPHLPVFSPPEQKRPKGTKGTKGKTTLLGRIAAQQKERIPNNYYSNGTATSFNWRSGRPMAGMLEVERSRTRRERTFIGSECAVCEEPLEHTLRGERILQFSCGHVSHEACFYEYIKEFESQYCPTCNAPLGLDTSRGGNVLDLEKLSSIVRSVSMSNNRENQQQQQQQQQQQPQSASSQRNTPVPWDSQNGQDGSNSKGSDEGHDSKDAHVQREREREAREREAREQQRERIEKYGNPNRQYHSRNGSTNTGGVNSSDGYGDSHPPSGRRHDYDVQSMETALSSPRASMTKNPIPAPTVTVRSEYPTLTRSRQQQSLTCLVTIEVPEGKWRPDPADLRGAPVMAPIQQEPNNYSRPKSPAQSQSTDWQTESPEVLEEITEDLRVRVDNWHGLDFSRFGKLRLFGTVRVGKDRQSWQELECFLFAEMLICVKEKKGAPPQYAEGNSKRKLTRCTLKGSILIKKHLKHVDSSPDEPVLTLSLSVQDLQQFHLQFQSRQQVEQWRRSLLDLNAPEVPRDNHEYEMENSGTDDDDFRTTKTKRVSSVNSSYGPKSINTAPTEYTASGMGRAQADARMPASIHVPLDIVVVIPVSSSMQGLKITLLRDALKFLVQNLGERDRMGLVTFGSSGGGVPLVGMTTKAWNGWTRILNSIRPVGQKSLRADVVEGANVAMDLLMQRKANNPIATILLISDSSTSDAESVDFVVSRAEAAKVAIHSFGLGLTHKPDTMIELSTRTKASYTYVKDWMMLRECVAGCLGAMQTTSHQNVKLKLRLPEGSPAKFVKISGALQITKRATGKDAEATLGDLRFGDKRDVLVQLVIAPDNTSQEHLPQDPWESIVSGLEALGGPFDSDEQRSLSVEEVPLIQADLTYGDILRDGTLTHPSRPSLLAITMLPANSKSKNSARPSSPQIPPHPSIVQRRMELLTSDMLTRALTLVSRGQHDRAHHLLKETRTILKGLGKGGLPPLPQNAQKGLSAPPSVQGDGVAGNGSSTPPPSERQPSPTSESGGNQIGGSAASGIDAITLNALDTELEASLEWINHPAVFGRDSRKAVLQAIGVIASQRGYTFRSPAESLWAGRVGGVKRLTKYSREWRDAGDESLMEEA